MGSDDAPVTPDTFTAMKSKNFIPLQAVFLVCAASLHAQGTKQAFDANGNLASVNSYTSALPQILSRPASQVVQPGQSTSLAVLAQGGAVTYLWRKNNVAIGGATHDSFTISRFAAGDEADYTVVVTNAAGSVISSIARLSLDSDRDGLADAWEATNFGDLSAGGNNDEDFDFRTNLEEFTDGTNPLDYQSTFGRLTITAAHGHVSNWPASSTGRYAPGTVVTLTALPASGYQLTGWLQATPTGLPNQAVVIIPTYEAQVTVIFSPVAGPASLAAAVDDNTGLVFTGGGAQPWMGETGGAARDGVDAARSGEIPPFSESWLQTTVTGQGTLSFWWRVSCGEDDGASLLVDGLTMGTLTGETTWQRVEIAVPSGTHPVRWRFARGEDFGDSGNRRAWLDSVVWTPAGAVVPALAEAIDQPAGVIVTGGTRPWEAFARFQPLTVTGFDADIIAGSTDAAGPAGNVWTAVTSTDLGTELEPVLREMAGAPADTYLPANGQLNEPDGIFQLAPDNAMNALRIGPLDSRTLAVTVPAARRALRLLALSAGGDAEMMCELDFSDGTRQSAPVLFRKWREEADSASEVALFSRTTGVSSPGYFLQTVSVPVQEENWGRDVSFITFRATGGSPEVVAVWVFAVSAAAAPEAGGDDFAASGRVGRDEQSWLSLALPGNQAASFRWRRPPTTTSVPFYLDGMPVPNTATGWHTDFYRLGNGSHVLTWMRQPGSEEEAIGEMVENVTAAASIPIAAALDSPLTWTSGGAVPWTGYALPDISHDGTDAGVSGPVAAGQESWLETQVSGPGTLAWQWKMSAGATDELDLMVDGDTVHALSGVVDWQPALHTFGSGQHTVRWRYVRALSTSPAQMDAAFVDEVNFTAGTPALDAALDLAAGVHVFSTGKAVWFSQTATTQDGVDAAAQGAIGDNDQSRLFLRATGPGTLSYWRKTSTATGDRLFLFVDGISVADTAGVNDWAQQQQVLPPGRHTVEWRYQKDFGGISGSDTVWLDGVQYFPSVSAPLADAAGTGSGSWLSGGSQPWSVTNAVDSHDGISALRSGPISHNQSSSFQTWVQGPLEMSFWWNVSSQLNGDLLTLYVDGVLSSSISGITGWLFVTRSIASGSHHVEWRYTKNGSNNSGLDRGVVDQVTYTPPPVPLNTALDDAGLGWISGGAGGWAGVTSASHDGTDSASNGFTAAGQESWMETTVTGPGTFTFWWKISAWPNGDYLHFTLDGVTRESLTGEVNWRPVTCSLPAGTHVLRWAFDRGLNGPLSSDAAWVDQATFTAADPGALLTGADMTGPSLVSSGTAAAWFRQTDVTSDGVDALRSGITPDAGESYITAVAQGPAMIAFDWRSSSEIFDQFHFSSDGTAAISLGGQWDWQSFQSPYFARVGSGMHVLKWAYEKNPATSSGDDAAWLDRVEVATAGPLAGSMEGTGLTFTTGGNAPWAGYNMASRAHDGTDLAASGDIGVGQSSWLETSVTGPGTLTFWWRSGATISRDTTVDVDGREWLDGSSGQAYTKWAPAAVALDAGSHTIRWQYVKTDAAVTSFDGIWLDEVAWVSQADPPLFAAFDVAVSPVVATGGGLWIRQTAVALDAGGALESGPLNEGDSTELITEFTGPGQVIFQHNNPGLFARFGPVSVIGTSLADGEGFWLPAGYPLGAGVHRAKWFVTPGFGSEPGAALRLDKINFGVTTPVSLAEAVDAPSLTWTTSPSLPWTGVAGPFSLSSDGADSARAPSGVPYGVESWVETTVTGPGLLTFDWITDGVAEFLIDGVEKIESSYGGLWFTENVIIAAGPHTLRWAQTGSSGVLVAGLDQVRWRQGLLFTEWQALHFSPEDLGDELVSGLDADPDGDFYPNGAEALLGSDPRSPNGDSFTSSFMEFPPPAQWLIAFNVSNSAPVDLVPGLEICTDLETDWHYVAGAAAGLWSAIPPATVSTADGPPGLTTVTVRVPATGNRIFARLTVVRAGIDAGPEYGTSGGGWGSSAAGGGPGADGSGAGPGEGGGGG